MYAYAVIHTHVQCRVHLLWVYLHTGGSKNSTFQVRTDRDGNHIKYNNFFDT